MNSTPSKENQVTKVVLIEDHAMFREQLVLLIEKVENFVVCGQADNIKDGMQVIRESHPDIAIVDVSLRGSSGLELIKDLKADGSRIPVLVLSMHDEELYAERVIRAGAKGYISKHEASSQLIEAIHQVLTGKVYLSERVTSGILNRMSATSAPLQAAGVELLTDRELEVFQLVGRGLNSRQIAERLNLGESTVDTYRARIKEKLQIRNASDLYTRAARWVHEQEA